MFIFLLLRMPIPSDIKFVPQIKISPSRWQPLAGTAIHLPSPAGYTRFGPFLICRSRNNIHHPHGGECQRVCQGKRLTGSGPRSYLTVCVLHLPIGGSRWKLLRIKLQGVLLIWDGDLYLGCNAFFHPRLHYGAAYPYYAADSPQNSKYESKKNRSDRQPSWTASRRFSRTS